MSMPEGIALMLTKEEAARIVEWFDDGMDEFWKNEFTGKEDEDLRFALWLAATSEPTTTAE